MNRERDFNSDPLCLLEDALAGTPQDALRTAEARGFLRDIAAAAEEAQRPRLSRFAAALDGLLELLETQAEDRGNGGGEQILGFVRDSVAPLRAAVADEPDAEERIAAALDVMNSQWGEYLSLMGADAAASAEDSIWSRALAVDDSDPWAGEDLTRTQTRAEIDRILGSLAGGAAAENEEFADQQAEAEAGNAETVETKSKGRGGRSARKSQKTNVQEGNPLGDCGRNACDGFAEPALDADGQLFGDSRKTVPTEPPPPVAIDLDADLLEAYLDDVSSGVGRLEQLVLAVETDQHDESLHRQICRELHTLKGASASVGLSDLAAYLHAVEDYIEAAKGTKIDVAPMLGSVDAVRRQVASLAGRSAPAPLPLGWPAGKSLEAAPPSSPAVFDTVPAGQEESLRVKASRVDRLMDLLAELVILRNQRDSRLSRLKQLHSELTRCVTRLRVFSDGANFAFSGRGQRGPDGLGFNPGSADDTLSQSTSSAGSGSVVEIASDVAELARTLRDLAEPMEAENVTISQFTRQFRMELIEMRRMPVSGLFQRLNRAARDAARTESRRIDFQLHGEHAGLDRSLQERLYEPLLHMVRNAVSHGIESPEDRRKAGKPETGTITLSAKGSPTTLVIEVSDDGRGLDYEAIRRKALDKGLLTVGEAVEESRLARLIFHPGFSTRQETNAISGRGVGMDVVAAALQRMRAKIDVESRAGQGTTMRLTIPLRSVIEHAMVVRVSGRLYALPMQFVQASRPLNGDSDDASRIAADEGVRLRTLLGDENSPLPEQEHMLLLGTGRLSFSAAAAAQHDPWDFRRQGTDRDRGIGMVLIVDDVVGPEEVVVRSLPSLLKSHPILGGVTLSGAGEIVQLLDGQRLLDFAAETAMNRRPARPAAPAAPPEPAESTENRRVLVVDDSLSARRRLVQLLKTMGFEVTEAGDGLEGLDRFRDGEFRFVFTDLEMPRMDGFEFLSEIRRASAVPMAVVSSRSEAECRERAKELGADGYLVKPATEPALTELVAQLEQRSGIPA